MKSTLYYTKVFLIIIIINLVFSNVIYAQKIGIEYIPNDKNAPTWIKQLLPENLSNVNVFKIDELVRKYHKQREKSGSRQESEVSGEVNEDIYLLYYKRWRNEIKNYIKDDGSIDMQAYESKPVELFTKTTIQPYNKQIQKNAQSSLGPTSNWSVIGPLETYWRKEHRTAQPPAPWQVNIYAIGVAASNPNILYAAPETGGIFKTTDKGLTWNLVLDQPYATATFTAIAVDPTNPNVVYVGRNNLIRKSTDGGVTWTSTTHSSGNVNTIIIKPTNTNFVFAATASGILQSSNAGVNWTLSSGINNVCYDIAFNKANDNTIIALAKNGQSNIGYISTNNGVSFASTNGWLGKGIDTASGCRLATTAANANVLYAVLLGSGASINRPFIFKSTDGGFNWEVTVIGSGTNLTGTSTLPLGMSNGQGFYDLDIVANPNNENEVIVATTTAYKSANGGFSFTALGGYLGTWSIHPDIQEMIAIGNDTWITTDGGINYSNDFFTANHQPRFKGIFGSDNWGFAQGWNEDMLGGGRYHNGNTVMLETYPAGHALRMGGGEAGTGYYMIGKERSMVFSDLNPGLKLPPSIDGTSTSFAFNKIPNEDGYGFDASEVQFHPTCYNIIYSGADSSLWKSSDGGISWTSIYKFPNRVKKYQVARSNPNVIYVSATNSLWKTTNGGTSWTQLTIPAGTSMSQLKIEVSFTNPDLVWIASKNNGNNNKIFKSTNGGASWINLTTSTLNNKTYENIALQQGTNGGIYLMGRGGVVFYKNDAMPDWVDFSANLPKGSSPLKTIPFYRDGKLRSASDRGYWEIDFYEESQPIVQPTVDKLVANCSRDTFYFDDYSVLKHSGATWNWSFPGASYVSSTTVRNPKVVYPNQGSYNVSLTITQNGVPSSITIPNMVSVGVNLCMPDTIPGNALSINAQNNYAVTNSLNISNTNTYTMMAWVKGNGVQADFAGILSLSTSTGSVHLNVKNYNTDSAQIGYHHPNGSWSYNSRLYLKPNVWTHVALVVDKNRILIYKDGDSAMHSGLTVVAANVGPTFKIGTMISREGDRTFNGLIDEVAIYDTVLNRNQIRELMNLTKQNPNYATQNNSHLLTYYQFNEGNAIPTFDKIKNSHLIFNGSNINKDSISSAPVGGGVAQTLPITVGGIYTYSKPGVDLAFPTSGNLPNGNVVVTRLNVPSNQLPNTNVLPNAPTSYYIVRNYGTNKTFAPINSVKFNNVQGTTNTMVTSPSSLALYKRSSNAYGNTWGLPIEFADVVTNNVGTGTVEFSSGLNLTSFSQFSIANHNIVVPIQLVDFKATPKNNKETLLNWIVANAIDFKKFEIEFSTDGILFIKIGELVSSANSHYQFIHLYPSVGKNYYRLKLINNDNSYKYSFIKLVNISPNFIDVLVTPNPSTDGWISLQWVGISANEDVNVNIVNSNGQTIKVAYLKTSNLQQFINVGSITGTYILKFNINNNASITKKILIK